MDQTNKAPMTDASAPQAVPMAPITGMTPAEHKKVGPIIATLIVIILIVAAVLYFMGSYVNKSNPQQSPEAVVNNTPVVANIQASTQNNVPAVTNTADDVNSLQADLNVSTQNLDSQSF